MEKKFNVVYLDEARAFLKSLDEKVRRKFYYIVAVSEFSMNDEKFKKLEGTQIWEFRVLLNKTKYRLLAFWDKSDSQNTLVLATNGFVKKTQKTPLSEIKKAEKIMKDYFELKKSKEK